MENKWMKRVAKTPWTIWIFFCIVIEVFNLVVFAGAGFYFDEHKHHFLSNIFLFIFYAIFMFATWSMLEYKQKADAVLKKTLPHRE